LAAAANGDGGAGEGGRLYLGRTPAPALADEDLLPPRSRYERLRAVDPIVDLRGAVGEFFSDLTTSPITTLRYACVLG
jgi:hypothetical protein